MARALFLFADWSDAATLTASSARSLYPVTRLQDVQPRRTWRTENLDPITIEADRGQVAAFNAVGALFSKASADATWAIRAAQSQAELDSNPVLATDGGFGPALRFDGVNDRAQSPASLGGLSSFTLEARARPRVALRQQGIAAHFGGTDAAWLLMRADGRVEFVSRPGLFGSVVSTSALALGAFAHLAGVYDAAAQTATLYVDGVSQGQATAVPAMTDGDRVELAPVHGERFRGDLDDVRLWSVARSGAQIAAAKDAELTGGELNLLAYWKLNDAQGTTGDDATATAADLTLLGDPLWVYPSRFWASPHLASYPRTHAFWFDAVGVSARWLRVSILDPTNANGDFELGRLVVGAGFQPQRNIQYGSSLYGFAVRSRAEDAPGGVTVVDAEDPVPELRRILVSSGDMEEMLTELYEIDRLRADHDPVLFVRDPEAAEATLHRQLFYGRLGNRREVVEPAFEQYEASYELLGMA